MVTSRQCFPQATVVGFRDSGIVGWKKLRERHVSGDGSREELKEEDGEGGKERRRRGA